MMDMHVEVSDCPVNAFAKFSVNELNREARQSILSPNNPLQSHSEEQVTNKTLKESKF